MKRLIIATATAAALLAGAGAASAQNFQGDGPDYRAAPAWNSGAAGLNNGPAWQQQDQSKTASPTNTEAFHSQELMPQSPPDGGY